MESNKLIIEQSKQRNKLILIILTMIFGLLIMFGSVSLALLNKLDNNTEAAECRSEIVNGYLTSIGDIIEDAIKEQDSTQEEIQSLIETREASRELYLDAADTC